MNRQALSAIFLINHLAYSKQGVAKDAVPHTDITPNHEKHLAAVMREAENKRLRKTTKKVNKILDAREEKISQQSARETVETVNNNNKT